MRTEERRWLVKCIREILLPAFHAQGFETLALTEQEKDGELPSVFPFGRLRRAREAVFDVVEIQTKRHGEPAFRISAGVVPSTGVDQPIGHVPADEAWASHLPQFYMLLGQPLIGRWFSLWHWPGRKITAADIRTYVTDITKSVILEIENALRDGRCGRHVRRIGW